MQQLAHSCGLLSDRLSLDNLVHQWPASRWYSELPSISMWVLEATCKSYPFNAQPQRPKQFSTSSSCYLTCIMSLACLPHIQAQTELLVAGLLLCCEHPGPGGSAC